MPGVEIFPGGMSISLLPLAYVDPTAGGLLLQFLIGGIAGAFMILKLYWHQLTSYFRKKPGGNPEPGDDSRLEEPEKTD